MCLVEYKLQPPMASLKELRYTLYLAIPCSLQDLVCVSFCRYTTLKKVR